MCVYSFMLLVRNCNVIILKQKTLNSEDVSKL